MISASQIASSLFLDEPTIGVMNRIKVDFNAVGNHEFDRGRDELLRMQNGGCAQYTSRKPCQIEPFKGAHFRFLAASTTTESGTTLFPATGLKSFGKGRRKVPVGIVGLTLKGTPELVSPEGIKGLNFGDEADAINAAVPRLKARGADAVGVLIHQGGRTTALTDPAGIDLVDTVANRTDDAVEVSFTVAGDIEGTTTNPAFILFRGQQAATQGSFEVQALRADDGTWALYLVEYLTNLGERDKLDVPVTVDGDTLSFTVPLPWSFGTYDGDRASVAELDAPSTSTTVPSTDPPEATVGFSDFCTPYDEVADGATTTTAG